MPYYIKWYAVLHCNHYFLLYLLFHRCQWSHLTSCWIVNDLTVQKKHFYLSWVANNVDSIDSLYAKLWILNYLTIPNKHIHSSWITSKFHTSWPFMCQNYSLLQYLYMCITSCINYYITATNRNAILTNWFQACVGNYRCQFEMLSRNNYINTLVVMSTKNNHYLWSKSKTHKKKTDYKILQSKENMINMKNYCNVYLLGA